MSFPQSKITNKFLVDLLKKAQSQFMDPNQMDETNIEQIWNLVIGEKMALLTQVKSWYQGILIVTVASATLNNLLSRTEKPKILAKIKKDYPFLKIKNLIFRSG